MENDKAIEILATLLHDSGEYVSLRVAAAEGLGYAGFSTARVALQRVIQDETEMVEVRAAAIRALGHTVYSAKP